MRGELLPTLMNDAIERFSASESMQTYLSEEFQVIFTKTKRQELDEFQRRVTDFEIESYLRG